MREAGKVLAEIMGKLKEKVKEGITTKELERAAQVLIFNYKAEPAFKGYKGFPNALCASVNSQVVHAAPSNYVLKKGDVLSLDLGIKLNGYFSDMAFTMAIGEVNPETARFIRITRKSLKMAINKAKPGNTFGDIGNTIQRYVEGQGFAVIRDLCGHGIGRNLHEEPQIANYGSRHKGEEIKEGMVFCIEPMTSMGDYRLKKSDDGFGYESKDGSLTCHFEHTLAILNGKASVLTTHICRFN